MLINNPPCCRTAGRSGAARRLFAGLGKHRPAGDGGCAPRRAAVCSARWPTSRPKLGRKQQRRGRHSCGVFHAPRPGEVEVTSTSSPVRESAMTTAATSSVYDFTAQGIDGKPVALGDYRGKVLLIVNTASECGF